MTMLPGSTKVDPLFVANKVDAICDQFEEMWKRNQRPRLEDFLANRDPQLARILFVELVLLDINYRQAAGETPSLEDYSTRFPEYSDVLSTLLQEGDNNPTARLTPRRHIGSLLLLEIVGSGSFGRVWKAWDQALERTVAVKVPTERLPGRKQHELFLREAKAAANLRHPGIVPVYGFGESDGHAYIVTHFVEGESLKHWLRHNRPTPQQVAEMCRAIALALDHAHQSKIVHRDLKPGNIMIDESGQLLITDFGLAKSLEGKSTIAHEGAVVGTPAYMSPEQASGSKDLDGRSDVYSLGTILYEMLTGNVPFTGQMADMVHKILHVEPAPVRSINKSIPKDLETICQKAMAKRREDRYATAGDMADDLQRFLDFKPITARRISPAGKFWRWICRQPGLAIGYFVATAAVLLSVVLALGSAMPEDDGKIEVRIHTEPAGADIFLTPLDAQTQLPLTGPDKHIIVPGKTPVSCRLAPGMYRVVASLDETRFIEVMRTVPPKTTIPLAFPYWSSKWVTEDVIEWIKIEIPEPNVTGQLILIPGADSVPVGIAGSEDSPRHLRTIKPFFVAPREYTIGEYVKRGNKRPPRQADQPDSTSLECRFDLATAIAERHGCRLLEEAEFDYLARLIQLRHSPMELAKFLQVSSSQAQEIAQNLMLIDDVFGNLPEWVWGAPWTYQVKIGKEPPPAPRLRTQLALGGATIVEDTADEELARREIYYTTDQGITFRLARSASLSDITN